jgi:hypothetical protein
LKKKDQFEPLLERERHTHTHTHTHLTFSNTFMLLLPDYTKFWMQYHLTDCWAPTIWLGHCSTPVFFFF